MNELGVVSMSQEGKRFRPRKEVYVGVLAIVATVALCAVAIYYKDYLMNITNMAGYSLLAVLILAFVAGSTVSVTMIPVPYWLLVFTLPSVLAPHWGILAPVWVGLVSALGATLGHIPTFIIGYGGSSISQRFATKFNNRLYNRVIEWAQRHGSWAVFFTSAMFNPMHLPMTLAIGALRFPPQKWFLFSLLGNAVKSLFIAFCGYLGLSSLFSFLGA